MLTADLTEAGWTVSKNTVAQLMAEMSPAARPRRRRRGTTRPGRGRWRAPGLVKRDFPARHINRKWYGDGTEIPTGEGKLQLASVLDMGSRRIWGFALGEHHDAELAYGALAMAVAVRGGHVPGVIMHTDQGGEYAAGRFRQACARLSISQSMGRPGSALDTRSSNRGIRPWNSSCGAWSTSRPGRPPGPGSRRGSRTTTTTAGTPRWAGSARWITSGPWRERTPRERGGPAARARQTQGRRRLRRRSSPGAPRRLRGRSSGLQGAAHRAARDSPAGCPGPRRPLQPLRQETRAGRNLPPAGAGPPGTPRRRAAFPVSPRDGLAVMPPISREETPITAQKRACG